MTPIRLALPAFAAAAFLAMPAFAAEPLALKRVLLSTGGVGYFEYEAKVTGNETLDLAVPLDQVDDVMKSIVVYDDKGGIGEISLPGREPLAAAFREMPFGPEALASPADLLNALRGAEVRVEGARGVSGRILSVVPETAKDKDGAEITRHRVSLMTTGGVRQFLLEEADGLQFADPALQAKLDAALAALARDSAKDRRTLAIRATGDGERTLRVGYVVEAPLWKTSYRLTLAADPKAETAALQGWAVLENMSGADWDGVDLTVVSGNPVTFRQALYQSYTVARPEVPVEVAGRVLPPVDERARDVDGDGGGAAPPRGRPRRRRGDADDGGAGRGSGGRGTSCDAPPAIRPGHRRRIGRDRDPGHLPPAGAGDRRRRPFPAGADHRPRDPGRPGRPVPAGHRAEASAGRGRPEE